MNRTLSCRINFTVQLLIMKILILFLIVLFSAHYMQAQFSAQWVHGIGSTGGDMSYNVTTDPSGNVIITGSFSNTVDFDPGPGVFNLTANNGDGFVARYSATGSFLWAFALGGTDSDIGEAIATDAAGNIYLGISFGATIDMDPGAGLANFTSVGFSSSVIAKYDANGNYIWGFMLASLSSSGISAIETDAANNVYFTGSYHGTVDFNPSPTVTTNLVSNGNSDIFFAKYDANGNYLFAKSFGAGAFDTGFFIELDGSGNIFVSGYYRLTVDFDPGPGTANITAVGTLNDIFFAKYDAAGNFLWARSLGSTSNDIPGGISIDPTGNVIVAGGFNGTVDFDPGGGTVNLTANGRDAFFAKYDVNGNYVWAKSIGSTGTETAYAITGDGSGGFYLTGEFSVSVDFDPDAPVFNLTAIQSTDVFIARYTSAGSLVHAGSMGGASSELPFDIALVDANNILITGYFQTTVDFDPGPGVILLNSAGIFDIFVGKYTSTTSALPVTLSSFTALCHGAGVSIKWSSKQEYNSKEYTLQKSNTGNSFEDVVTIPAAGQSNSPLHYFYSDNNAFPNKTYYRLKQTDRDGKFTYSKIITVGCNGNEPEVYLFPNPAVNEITISIKNNSQKVRSIVITDVSGRTIKWIQPLASAGNITLDVRSLQKGIYWVRIDTEVGELVTRFVKVM